MGVVKLVVLACVLRATTKKVVEERCTPEKILATPMRLYIRGVKPHDLVR